MNIVVTESSRKVHNIRSPKRYFGISESKKMITGTANILTPEWLLWVSNIHNAALMKSNETESPENRAVEALDNSHGQCQLVNKTKYSTKLAIDGSSILHFFLTTDP